ncbi:MAG TPA: (d)CMP kinase [Persephonella sp.]|uniref:Cytidylate kinase n=1 Tax=Persephonella marina (strain DSM 14350 / EX-H1) TaxID=123214 RepID=C0QTD3_PERMH|nr:MULTISPECIES: (d)CMP kinase [Persephonella]ACO04273.1 cytidylate kinase [Persephonella marina EX-H1]HCB70433.1 (d)CMP kinase [Persephonella sp.]
MIIAIDGPAGSGKSTVAKKLSRILGYTYIDTGAMYRAVAYKVKEEGIDPDNPDAVVNIMKRINIKLEPSDNGVKVFLDGEDVSSKIRTEEIGKIASKIARHPEVRKILVQKQREMGKKAKNAVIEGRDTGTVIFPDADLKIFMTASPEVRARRRWEELKNKGLDIDYNRILKEVKERDHLDQTRKDSPLRPAKDAIIIDTTNKSIDEVINQILELVRK